MFRGTYTSIQSHFYMINDDHRTNSFIKAIQQKVNKNSTVIDLGSGTGILGLECAKAGAKQVHLVEQESKLASIIQEAVQHKNLKQTCIVHNKRSDDFFKSFNESADLIVCEGIGDHIFESRMIYDFLLYKEKLNITHSIPESFKLCIHSHTVKINRQRLGEHQELIDKLDIEKNESINKLYMETYKGTRRKNNDFLNSIKQKEEDNNDKTQTYTYDESIYNEIIETFKALI